jgi:amino acid transporter
MRWSALTCVVSFCSLPIALFGLFGGSAIASDPFLIFAAAGHTLFGERGEVILGVGLIAVLVFGAEAFIVGSSRTIYQMACDGYLPGVFAKVNRHGAPIGSIAWDAAVITTMLAVFGTSVVHQVAAANFGYLIVFTLLPVTYIAVSRRHRTQDAALKSLDVVILAPILFAFNLTVLVVGGSQWGWKVVGIGLAGSLVIVPIVLLSSNYGLNHALARTKL